MDTKPCPFCKEDIAVSAKKCRFCNEWLDKSAAARGPAPAGAGAYAACPNCHLQHAEKMGFTWWGGVLGPALLTHVKCKHCNTQYNGKTGKSNNTAIGIYTLVGLGLGILIFVAIAMSK